MKKAICVAIIQDNKILLVQKENFWILPGGKPEKNESELETLCREVSEELSGTKLKNIIHYNKFEGKSPRKGYNLEVEVYFAEIKGRLFNVRKEDSIKKYEWTSTPTNYNLSEVTSKIIKQLEQDKFLY